MSKNPAGRVYTCPICGAVSHNLRDVQERYCGRCHMYESDADCHWLMCIRVLGMPKPPMRSHKDRCSRCGSEVWRAESSPVVNEGQILRVICKECLMSIRPKELDVRGPTEKQKADLRKYYQ